MFVPCDEKIAKNILPPIGITVTLPTCSISKLANVPGSNAVMSDDDFF